MARVKELRGRLAVFDESLAQRLLRRYRDGGLEALEPRSRRPRSSPGRTPEPVRERIVALRTELTARGLDAGPVTIAWHMGREGLAIPSTSTIRRVLHAAGLVVPEPHKRPRSSWLRFEAAAPNELWQSDVSHWRLADGTEVEICSWLDDHSRYLLGCTAFRRVSGDDVVATFCAAGEAHGWPAATLTDNGSVYTSRFTGGRNAFEYLLAYLGIRQKNGAPGHPQTQGKIERSTRPSSVGSGSSPRRGPWPSCRPSSTPSASSMTSNGRTGPSDESRLVRPTGRDRRPILPGAVPRAPSACAPTSSTAGGRMSLRRGGRMHHLGIGAANARQRVVAIVDEHEVTVVALDTGEVLSTHHIEPERTYWRDQRRDPGRWPGSRATE